MTDIVIAAAAVDAARATAMAEALRALGYDVAAHPAEEADVAKAVEEAKCVLALWSPSAAASPWLAAQAMLALDRKKLVCAELDAGTTPAPLEAAPRTNLDARDRLVFKQRFQALLSQIERLAPCSSNAEALPLALAKARSAVAPVEEPVRRTPRPGGIAAAALATVVVLFGVGVGVSKLSAGGRLFPRTPAATAVAPAARGAAPAPAFSVSEADLESLPWRAAAAKIGVGEAARIKAGAEHGSAYAQTLACLGHMAGASGFLPSPSAAGGFCDAAAAQGYRPALYLSWLLARRAPNAPVSEDVARERLAEAARRGLTAAQIDYALLLAPDAHAPTAQQVAAGRLLLGAAEQGDARGQYFYARWLRDSPAGPRDPATAIPYLTHASDAGLADAQHMLATLYRDGIGVPRDPARAQALYERAAAQNFAPAMLNLADILRGSDRDRAAALYRRLVCMRDERQIAPLAGRRLRAMGLSASCP